MSIELYVLIWVLGIVPAALLNKKFGDLRQWEAFWCGFWWPAIIPFLVLLLPIYLAQQFVKRYL